MEPVLFEKKIDVLQKIECLIKKNEFEDKTETQKKQKENKLSKIKKVK